MQPPKRRKEDRDKQMSEWTLLDLTRVSLERKKLLCDLPPETRLLLLWLDRGRYVLRVPGDDLVMGWAAKPMARTMLKRRERRVKRGPT